MIVSYELIIDYDLMLVLRSVQKCCER